MVLRGDVLMARVGLPLSLLQRILLTTDGTVTHVLEAYGDERIRVVKLEHSEEPSRVDHPGLEMSGPETVMRRTILLQGMSSGRNYLYAESAVLVDRLEPALGEGLRSTDEPIGKLLVASRLETFREVLSCGQELAGTCARHFGIHPSAPLVVRTYRVIAGGRPIMLITEKFPATDWADGSDQGLSPDGDGVGTTEGMP